MIASCRLFCFYFQPLCAQVGAEVLVVAFGEAVFFDGVELRGGGAEHQIMLGLHDALDGCKSDLVIRSERALQTNGIACDLGRVNDRISVSVFCFALICKPCAVNKRL